MSELVMVQTVGDRLRQARNARGLSQVDVANACKVTRAAVSLWESGATTPNNDNLETAARKLHVAFDWLRTGRGGAPDLRPAPVLSRKKTMVAFQQDPPAEGMIPEQTMGIGSGPMVLDGGVHAWWSIPPGLVKESLRTDPQFLVFLRVLSDSMCPTIKRGDVVLIDQSQTQPIDDHIFAIDNGVGAILRRVRVNGSDVTLHADNDAAQEITLQASAVRIIGRSVGAFVFF
jgi:phage repressor protein C with HTH and peptisase S24 domain